jgi:hypothetical protein
MKKESLQTPLRIVALRSDCHTLPVTDDMTFRPRRYNRPTNSNGYKKDVIPFLTLKSTAYQKLQDNTHYSLMTSNGIIIFQIVFHIC